MNKQEKKRLKAWADQVNPPERGKTWTGYRPAVFEEGKYNKKKARQEAIKIYKNFIGGD